VFHSLPVTFLLQLDSHNFSSEMEKFCSYFLTIEKKIQSIKKQQQDQA